VRLEGAWEAFLEAFDHIVATRIARDQAKGLTPRTDPLHLARALNRMDAAMLIRAFGSDPKEDRETVLAALEHVWLSAVYPSAAPPTRDERPL
jgi:Fe-S-cluster formation regulator IscX/YfhJ